MPEFSLNPVGHPLLAAALAVGLLALLLLGPAGSRTSRRRRLVLMALRLGVFLLVIASLLRPTLIYTETRQQQATLVVLADVSRSMQVADAFGNKTRYEALVGTLRDAVPALKELAEDLEIRIYTFDADAHDVDFRGGQFQLPEKPAGEQTALGWVLEEVLRRETGKRLAGVVLLSDGALRAVSPRDVPPQVPAARMRDLDFKLYTLAFGQSRGLGQARDVAVPEFRTNETVYVKNELVATGTVRFNGVVDQQVPIELQFETKPGQMETVSSKPLRALQDGQQLPVELSYVPQTPGEYKVTLRAEPQQGELVTTNNQLSTFITVLKGGLNVLYLQGALRPEETFLGRSLDGSPDIQFDLERIDAQKPETRPPDLADRFEPGKYDVYMIGDLDAKAFETGELERLRQAVDRGAGLIMLGGFHSFGPGGYTETALADVLPIRMEKTERQQFNDQLRPDVHLKGPLTMVPSPRAAGLTYVTRLSNEDNLAAWQQLPPLDGANKFDANQLKPAAHVLAETPQGAPLLVAQEAGAGRVLAFAGDSTWRWWMHGKADSHKRFWRQVVLWLAHKDETSEGNVWIKLAQRRYAPGGRVEFTAGARSPEGDVVIDADFQAEVVLPDGKRQPLPLSRSGEEMTGSFVETRQAGDYTVVVTASRGGESLGTAQSRFLVYEQDLELDNSAADHTSLSFLASQTGGEMLAPEQLPALLERLKKVPQQLAIKRETKAALWDRWPLFVAFAVLLSVEWFLRKKWGLV